MTIIIRLFFKKIMTIILFPKLPNDDSSALMIISMIIGVICLINGKYEVALSITCIDIFV